MTKIKYLWRRYLGLIPIQFCMVCGRPYWGGLPCTSVYALKHGRLWQWKPCWKDYCSRECADLELNMLDDNNQR